MTPASWPTFDVAEIAQEACDRAGLEFRSGYSLRSARRSLELISIEWGNRGLNLWTIEGPTAIDLFEGQNRYELPDDTIDLIEHVIRFPLRPTNQDFPLSRMTVSEYAVLPNKMARGRPTLIHIRREIHPYFLIWMVPPAKPPYQLLYWRLRRMVSVGSGGTGTPEIPWRFVPAMIAGLAYRMAQKATDPNVLARLDSLKASYEEEFQLASDEDRDRASFRFVPAIYEF